MYWFKWEGKELLLKDEVNNLKFLVYSKQIIKIQLSPEMPLFKKTEFFSI